MDINDWYSKHIEPIDLENASEVEIVIRGDGKVLWLNAPGCIVRICRIKGKIKVVDNRKRARYGKS